MQKIPINLAAAGMVLARDIYKNDNPTGMPICGKGTELSDSLLSRLMQMGIQSLYVEGHPVWQEGDKTLEEQLADLGKRFAKTMDNRQNMVLMDIYSAHITAAMEDSGGREKK